MLAVLVLLTGGAAWAQSPEAPILLQGPAGPYQVRALVTPYPPQVGRVQYVVQVEVAGKAATGLQAGATVRMPSMLRAHVGDVRLRETSPGRYEGEGDLAMAGDWAFHFRLSGEHGTGSIRIVRPVVFPGAPQQPTTVKPTVTHMRIPYSVKVLSLDVPRQAGRCALEMEVRDSSGRPADGVRVRVGIDMPGMVMKPPPIEATRSAPGRYEAGFYLSMDGLWKITVQVDGPLGRFVQVLPQVTVGQATRVRPSLAVALALILGGGLVGLVALRWRRHPHGSALCPLCVVGSVAVLIAVIGVGQLMRRHWPADGSMGMAMDMTAPDMGMSMRDFAAAAPVLTQAVARGTLERIVEATATVVPASELAVVAPVGGVVSAVSARPGDVVRRGAPLATVGGTPINAPADGVVTGGTLEVGATVSAGAPIARIGSLHRVCLRAVVSPDDLPLLRPGTPVRYVVPRTTRRETARLDSVARMVDPETRSGRVEACVPNRGGGLVLGEELPLEIVAGQRPDVLSVPRTALVTHAGATAVWVVEPVAGRFVARAQPVRLGMEGGRSVEVLVGLKPGDVVVTAGQEGLRNGTVVERAKYAAAGNRPLLLPGAQADDDEAVGPASH